MKNAAVLSLDRCPHCGIAHPNLPQQTSFNTSGHDRRNQRVWTFYVCQSCGGALMTLAPVIGQHQLGEIVEMWPAPDMVPEELPARAKDYLGQAIASLHAPAGAIMLAASSIDAMLKDKGLKDGVLYARIEKAAAQHLITEDMKAWAHEVRLDANDHRHADENAPLATQADARKVVEFAKALAQFLYVLPARVARGRAI